MLKRSQGLALFILLLFLTPLLLWLYLKAGQFSIRHAMEKQLEQQHLDTIRMPVKDLIWYKKDKELVIGKDLFDVKHIIVEGDTALVTGLFDHAETKIKARIQMLQQQQQQNEQSSQTIISKLLKFPWSVPAGTEWLAGNPPTVNTMGHPWFKSPLITTYKSLFYPPPEKLS